MKVFNESEVWFITGSQHLYGEETLRKVEQHVKEIVAALNSSEQLPVTIVYKPIVKIADEITQVIKDANYNDKCVGLIMWMHTFSPAKMWINGLKQLNKPMLHLHTQYNRELPANEIDMDFMNTNQSAHGDREHGFIGARLRMPRKIVVGYYKDEDVMQKIGNWMRVVMGVAESRKLKAVRFGDNMREVAVTEGDKVEAQIKLGWSVNTYGVGKLVEEMQLISDNLVNERFAQYEKEYDMQTDNIDSVKYQIKIELAMEKFFKENGFTAFTTTFEDLYGLKQLPGMACQSLMKKGYGFGGEGDWKVACLLRVMKKMAQGLNKGAAFMEDYTYHLEKDNELILGSHMLEVCPSIAEQKPKIIVKPLSIGDREAPARMIFDGRAGKAICTTLVDMGGRFRMIVADVEAVKPIAKMPNLPVACTMWKPLPNLKTSAEAWILAGGAHHSVLSYDLTAEEMRDFAEIMDIEFVHIGENTNIEELKKELMIFDLVWKLK